VTGAHRNAALVAHFKASLMAKRAYKNENGHGVTGFARQDMQERKWVWCDRIFPNIVFAGAPA
jgi:hypothetical protein